MDIAQARAKLQSVPGYAWLLNTGETFWTVAEVSGNLNVGKEAIRNWCEGNLIPGAVFYGKMGWRIPTDGLILYLAERVFGASDGIQKQA
jgi:hypothetical protein